MTDQALDDLVRRVILDAAQLYAGSDGVRHLVWQGGDPDDNYWITACLTGGELIKIAESVGQLSTTPQ